MQVVWQNFLYLPEAAGEDRPTVVIPVDTIPGEKPIDYPSRDIAKRQKAGSLAMCCR